MADLLLELFSEEIPARMQEAAAALLKERMLSALEGAGLAAEITSQEVRTFVTPRRLAVRFAGIPVSQPDVTTERKGPRVDAPAAAIEGFLRSTGLTLPQLENRGGVYFAAVHQKGRPTAEVLQEMIEKILAEFTWPKSMRWGMHDIRWVRPHHGG